MPEPNFTPEQAKVLFHIWRSPKTYAELADLTGRSLSAVKNSVADLQDSGKEIIGSRVATDRPSKDGRPPNEYFLIRENIVSTPDLAVLLVTAHALGNGSFDLEEKYKATTGYDDERIERRFKTAESMGYLGWDKSASVAFPILRKRLYQEYRYIELVAAEFEKPKADIGQSL